MEQLVEELYSGRRNAITSWQGYEYQGMMGLLRFLEKLVSEYRKRPGGPAALDLKLKIEWVEDFVLLEDGRVTEIHQIKKTLTSLNRAEVLSNFILQFKILADKDMKWCLGYGDTALKTLELSCLEFEQFYNEFIRDRWIKQIGLLVANYKDICFWKKNLNLNEKSSLCKDIRSYLRNKFGKEKYDTEVQRESICNNILIPLKNRLVRGHSDYSDFKKCLEFRQVGLNEVDNNCIQRIRELFGLGIKRNLLLTEGDILAKLFADMYRKMQRLEKDEDLKNFKYEEEDILRILLDEEQATFRWEAALYRRKEKLWTDLKRDICSICATKSCSACIINTVKEWGMRNFYDNINLELPLFSAEREEESRNNKLSDTKHDVLMDILNYHKMQLRLRENDIAEMNHQYVLSSMLQTGNTQRKNNIRGIMDNYWAHSKIYRDYDNVLTNGFDYSLDESQLSILKEEGEREGFPLFNEIRNTRFVHYEGVTI